MVRTTATEPQTALAGVILKISLVRFKASMATFSEERMFSRRSCRSGFGVMVEARGGRQEGAWRASREDSAETSGHFDLPRVVPSPGRAERGNLARDD